MPLTLDSPYEDVARAIIAEVKRRGYTRDEAIGVVADGIQESGLRPRAHNPAGWDGIYQQDTSYPGRFVADTQITGFLDRLDVKRKSAGHGDIWLNIFWLQQRPSDPSAQTAYDRGRKAYLTEIQSRTAEATRLVNLYWPATGGAQPVTWTGDPTWLEDVLRPVLGSNLKAMPGWQNSGHGDYSDIRGVMVHHTGNGRASAQSIRDGRPDLPGPLSNLHIAQDGTVTIVAVGVCWHAGQGSYPWLPTDNGNQHLIGIECAWPMDTSITPATQTREQWPSAEVISMRDTCAAIVKRLGFDSDRVIGHKEYAGAVQGKWDPGNMDMNWLRGEVSKSMRGEFNTTPPPVPPPGVPVPSNVPDYDKETWDQIRARWEMLGYLTLVEAMAQVRDATCGTSDAGKTGVRF